VAFSSTATDLGASPADTGATADIYVQEATSGAGPSVSNRRFSIKPPSLEANNISVNPDLTEVDDLRGCVVVYESDANNLDSGDSNSLRDVFERVRISYSVIFKDLRYRNRPFDDRLSSAVGQEA
jgi:hypothetical protein